MVQREKKILEFNIKDIKDGTCVIKKSEFGEKFAICKEGDKIKIYPVISEE